MSEITVNGAPLYYEEYGTGEPILCIHGTGSSVELWRDAAVELGSRGRAIVYDRRGFSRSRRQERYAARTEEHTDDAAALIDALTAAPAIVVGRSHGGEIAVDLALRYPELVRGLALLEGGGFTLSEAFKRWDADLARRVYAAAELDIDTVGETMLRDVLGDGGWEKLPEGVKRVFTANGAAIVAEFRGGYLPVTAGDLGAIAHPTLLVAAEDSPPELAEVTSRLAQAMPGARVEWVEGGHLIDPAHPAVLRFVDVVLASTGAPAGR
jgi:pimeloyl-ACP methyl ester carboxylesterase